jgi:cyclic pyranopterin phosphate synthase
MVDVTAKDVTSRRAVAEGHIVMSRETLGLIVTGKTPKGDVIQVAELAGVMAGKKTADLIPLCHALPGTTVQVSLVPDDELPGLRARAEARVADRTGVEMEALTAVSVACLTIYDMLKAADKAMTLGGIRLIEKTGGRSGTFRRF